MGAQLSGTDFSGAILKHVSFDGSRGFGINFDRGIVHNVTYDGTESAGSTFRGSIFGVVGLHRRLLKSVDFDGALVFDPASSTPSPPRLRPRVSPRALRLEPITPEEFARHPRWADAWLDGLEDEAGLSDHPHRIRDDRLSQGDFRLSRRHLRPQRKGLVRCQPAALRGRLCRGRQGVRRGARPPARGDSRPVQFEPRINGSISRVNRDIRFSKDKRPYKEHLDLWFWHGDKRSWERPGFWFSLTPKAVYCGSGMYMFQGSMLEGYRQSVIHPRSGKALAAGRRDRGQGRLPSEERRGSACRPASKPMRTVPSTCSTKG